MFFLIALLATPVPSAVHEEAQSILRDRSIQTSLPGGRADRLLNELDEAVGPLAEDPNSGDDEGSPSGRSGQGARDSSKSGQGSARPGRERFDRKKAKRILSKVKRGTETEAERAELESELKKAGLSPQEIRRLIDRARGLDTPPPSHTTSSIASSALWMLIVVCAVLLIAWLAMRLSGFNPEVLADADEAEAGPNPDLNVIAAPLADADTLAQKHNFGAAAHALLLRTLRELSAKLETPLPPALTSREVLAEVELGHGARAALGGIIDIVEVSHFGDTEIGEPEYRQCLALFDSFASAYLGAR